MDCVICTLTLSLTGCAAFSPEHGVPPLDERFPDKPLTDKQDLPLKKRPPLPVEFFTGPARNTMANDMQMAYEREMRKKKTPAGGKSTPMTPSPVIAEHISLSTTAPTPQD